MMKDKAVNEEKPRADEVGGKEPPNYARIFAPKEILPNGEFEAPLVMRFFNGVERVVGSGVLVQQDGAQVVTVTIGQDALEILGLKLWTVIETAPLEDTKLKFVLQKNEED